jgi:hypothetical protein
MAWGSPFLPRQLVNQPSMIGARPVIGLIGMGFSLFPDDEA